MFLQITKVIFAGVFRWCLIIFSIPQWLKAFGIGVISNLSKEWAQLNYLQRLSREKCSSFYFTAFVPSSVRRKYRSAVCLSVLWPHHQIKRRLILKLLWLRDTRPDLQLHLSLGLCWKIRVFSERFRERVRLITAAWYHLPPHRVGAVEALCTAVFHPVL